MVQLRAIIHKHVACTMYCKMVLQGGWPCCKMYCKTDCKAMQGGRLCCNMYCKAMQGGRPCCNTFPSVHVMCCNILATVIHATGSHGSHHILLQ